MKTLRGAFEEILEDFLPEILLLIAPRWAERLKLEHGRFLEPEALGLAVKEAHPPSAVFATTSLSGEPVAVPIHFAEETDRDQDFERRVARYGLSFWVQHDVPVLSVVFFLQVSPQGEAGAVYQQTVTLGAAKSWSIRYPYLAVAPRKGKAESYLRRKLPIAAALAVLMPYTGGSPVKHKLRCLQAIHKARELNPQRRRRLLRFVHRCKPLGLLEEEEFQKRITAELREALEAAGLGGTSSYEAGSPS